MLIPAFGATNRRRGSRLSYHQRRGQLDPDAVDVLATMDAYLDRLIADVSIGRR